MHATYRANSRSARISTVSVFLLAGVHILEKKIVGVGQNQLIERAVSDRQRLDLIALQLRRRHLRPAKKWDTSKTGVR